MADDVNLKSEVIPVCVKVGMVQQALLAVAAGTVRLEVTAYYETPAGRPYMTVEFYDTPRGTHVPFAAPATDR